VPIVVGMICVELAFTDDQRRLALRPAHRVRLEALQQQGMVLAAGPFADDSGALIVFCCDAETVESELGADPYYQSPGVTVHHVREWCPVVGP
jgi:uncharacterized protein